MAGEDGAVSTGRTHAIVIGSDEVGDAPIFEAAFGDFFGPLDIVDHAGGAVGIGDQVSRKGRLKRDDRWVWDCEWNRFEKAL